MVFLFRAPTTRTDWMTHADIEHRYARSVRLASFARALPGWSRCAVGCREFLMVGAGLTEGVVSPSSPRSMLVGERTQPARRADRPSFSAPLG